MGMILRQCSRSEDAVESEGGGTTTGGLGVGGEGAGGGGVDAADVGGWHGGERGEMMYVE